MSHLPPVAMLKERVVAVDNVPVSTYICFPVSVPHRVEGFLPVGPVAVKLSVQAPAVVSVISNSWKSKRNWQIFPLHGLTE